MIGVDPVFFSAMFYSVFSVYVCVCVGSLPAVIHWRLAFQNNHYVLRDLSSVAIQYLYYRVVLLKITFLGFSKLHNRHLFVDCLFT